MPLAHDPNGPGGTGGTGDLKDMQARFSDGVYRQDGSLLPQIRINGMEASARFNLYRTSVRGILTEGLRGVYPVIDRLVGGGFFDHLADQYINLHPSLRGDLHQYGGHLAEFLETFKAAEGLPYIADVAGLEWAIHQVFHGANESPLDLARLAEVPADQQEDLGFELQSAVRLITSEWPIHRIWQVNQADADDQQLELVASSHWLVVFRQGLEVQIASIQAEDFLFLQQLRQRDRLATVCEAVIHMNPDADPGAILGHWINQGVIRGFFLSD